MIPEILSELTALMLLVTVQNLKIETLAGSISYMLVSLQNRQYIRECF